MRGRVIHRRALRSAVWIALGILLMLAVFIHATNQLNRWEVLGPEGASVRQVFATAFWIVFSVFCLVGVLGICAEWCARRALLWNNRRLLLCKERYRLALAHMAHLVFEYDLEKGQIYPLWRSGRDVSGRTGVPAGEFWQSLIHPQSQAQLEEMQLQLSRGTPKWSALLQAHIGGESRPDYRWCRITLTRAEGRRELLIGSLTDVNEQYSETLTLREKAAMDPLTGLYNREECRCRVENALSAGRCGMFLLMDLDGFKVINDSLGHPTGDDALRLLAGTLRRVFRESDVFGRMGGDEFMVWIRDAGDSRLVERKTQELMEALRAEMHGREDLPDLHLSIGIVPARPGDRFPELYGMADQALYQAKREGRGRYIFHMRD